jgi:hypothetical protein
MPSFSTFIAIKYKENFKSILPEQYKKPPTTQGKLQIY